MCGQRVYVCVAKKEPPVVSHVGERMSLCLGGGRRESTGEMCVGLAIVRLGMSYRGL